MRLTHHRIVFLISSVLIIGLLTLSAQAQDRGHDEARISPNATVSQTIGTTKINVTYGRPSVKGRQIFGDLEPFGEVWRTGANESTVIVLPTDVTVEGKALKAGTYSIYTIPGKNKWTIIFNSKLSWGTKYDKSKDVLRVQVNPEQAPAMEQLLIYFKNVTSDSADLVIYWNKTKVPVTLKV